ncbi:MAG: hypothetical protein F6K58_18485 [Symploca sp. SIO2E9]|nr:hypothetical protein [Symploca sp. SIO2E9]
MGRGGEGEMGRGGDGSGRSFFRSYFQVNWIIYFLEFPYRLPQTPTISYSSARWYVYKFR